MKARKLTLLAAAVALALPLAAHAATSPMKAGKWQMTIQVEMPNMPVKMPPTVTTVCVTPEEAQNPKPPKMQNTDCKVNDYKMEGNTVTWSMDCPKQKMTGSGKIVYSSDSYDGSMKMQIGEQFMSGKFTGKRLGDCEK
ncbi:MAG: DUF3617 family protein [Acidobacteria bacterium]|nr:DUF3617 family protein [Acidobacteriota bacterium]